MNILILNADLVNKICFVKFATRSSLRKLIKCKIKQAIKERIRLLAGAYISLAGFVDDDDILFAEDNPKSKKTRAIYLKVLEDMDQAKKEMREFKVL
jgi:hypothetical protein